MKLAMYNGEGAAVGEKDLPERLFAAPINKNVLYEALKNHLANKRQGTASVKTVSTVHGTTSKPWRQKGTGRARAGTNKSPLWKGGGVTFGPQPRDYSYSIPKKVAREAYATVFSLAAQKGKLALIEDVLMTEYKTRALDKIFKAITKARKVLYIAAIPTSASEEKTKYDYMRRSARNIPWLKVVNVAALEIKDLYYAEELVLSASAVTYLGELSSKWHVSRRKDIAEKK
ncbi:50S ribosomal protein L4 [Spirochaetota bacterium]|nr:50S ribosomal protein L4 [Spirochaetota bacterium]